MFWYYLDNWTFFFFAGNKLANESIKCLEDALEGNSALQSLVVNEIGIVRDSFHTAPSMRASSSFASSAALTKEEKDAELFMQMLNKTAATNSAMKAATASAASSSSVDPFSNSKCSSCDDSCSYGDGDNDDDKLSEEDKILLKRHILELNAEERERAILLLKKKLEKSSKGNNPYAALASTGLNNS